MNALGRGRNLLNTLFLFFTCPAKQRLAQTIPLGLNDRIIEPTVLGSNHRAHQTHPYPRAHACLDIVTRRRRHAHRIHQKPRGIGRRIRSRQHLRCSA